MKTQFNVEKALAHSVVLIASQEGYFRGAAMMAIRELLGEDEEEIASFGGDERPFAAWIAEAGTAPFIAARRTVVVRNLARAGSPKKLVPDPTAALKTLGPLSLLILTVDEEPGDEDRQKTYERHRKEWIDLVGKAGGFVYDPKVESGAVAEMLQEEFRRFGKQASPKVCQLLAEMVGVNLTRAREEVEKIINYVGEGDRVAESDVRAVTIPSPEWSIWKLVDAVFEGQTGGTLRELQGFLASFKSPQEAAFRQVLPMLARQLRFVWQARACLDAGAYDARTAPQEAQRAFTAKGLNTLSEWQAKRAFQSARKTDHERLARCFALISDADAAIKGILPSVDAVETIERMCLSMSRELSTVR